MKNELEIYLKAKGIDVPQERLNYLEMVVLERAERQDYIKPQNFALVQGGNHADDVAVVLSFAKGLGAREGFDWAWSPEYDNYHFSIGYNPTPKGKELLKKVQDYQCAQIRALNKDLKVAVVTQQERSVYY